MIGRAGRPGYDTSGTAVIMTDNKSKAAFLKLAASGLPAAKSQLLQKLDEIMNAEISQRVITSIDSAVNWLKGSLYHIQLVQNPFGYGVRHSVDAHLIRVCQESIQRLRGIGALEHDKGTLRPLAASHIMVREALSRAGSSIAASILILIRFFPNILQSQHMVAYQAMQLIVQIPFDTSQGCLIKTLSAIEGAHRPVRRSEKKCLNETQLSSFSSASI